MVRVHPDPPVRGVGLAPGNGGVAQLGEHLLCKQGVIGSIPFTSTTFQEVRSEGTVVCLGFCLLGRRYRLFFNKQEEVRFIVRGQPRGMDLGKD